MERLVFNASRDAYSVEDIRRTMTVGDLIDLLNNFDEDTRVYLAFDGGYTYGSVREEDFVTECDD